VAQDDLTVEVHGVRELASGSAHLAQDLAQSAPHSLLDAAGSASEAARGRVPRVSGRLASSVHTGVSRDAAWVGFGAGLPYAGWIEFGGTRGRAYVPEGRFLYPAAKDTEQTVTQAAERAAINEIGAFHWPTPTT
jgi:phage gpG-like protein